MDHEPRPTGRSVFVEGNLTPTGHVRSRHCATCGKPVVSVKRPDGTREWRHEGK